MTDSVLALDIRDTHNASMSLHSGRFAVFRLGHLMDRAYHVELIVLYPQGKRQGVQVRALI